MHRNPAPQQNLAADSYFCPAHPTSSAQCLPDQWPVTWTPGERMILYTISRDIHLLRQHSTTILMSICVIHSPTTRTEEDLPQIISSAHRVMSVKILNGSLSTCFSSFSNKTPPCSFITSRKSFKIAKWNVGVIIFLRDRHLSPVLQKWQERGKGWNSNSSLLQEAHSKNCHLEHLHKWACCGWLFNICSPEGASGKYFLLQLSVKWKLPLLYLLLTKVTNNSSSNAATQSLSAQVQWEWAESIYRINQLFNIKA